MGMVSGRFLKLTIVKIQINNKTTKEITFSTKEIVFIIV